MASVAGRLSLASLDLKSCLLLIAQSILNDNCRVNVSFDPISWCVKFLLGCNELDILDAKVVVLPLQTMLIPLHYVCDCLANICFNFVLFLVER